MNLRMAKAAVAGIHGGNYELEPGYCEKYFREICQSVYGGKYDQYFAASARQTGQNFLDAGVGVRFNGDYASVQLGDGLFKETGSGNFGHVGIAVKNLDPQYGDNLVAENSSTPYGRIRGALGYRTLGPDYPQQWGPPQVVVRLAVDPRLILGFKEDDGELHYEAVPGATLVNDSFMVSSLVVAHLLGADASKLSGGTAPIRDVLEALGVQITSVDGSKMSDPSDPRSYVFVK